MYGQVDIELIKKIVSREMGVPASLLTGETTEENIAQAKALLAYQQEHASKEGAIHD